jgi:hypothetical protein
MVPSEQDHFHTQIYWETFLDTVRIHYTWHNTLGPVATFAHNSWRIFLCLMSTIVFCTYINSLHLVPLLKIGTSTLLRRILLSSHCAAHFEKQYINQQMRLITHNSLQVSKFYMFRHQGDIFRKSSWTKEYQCNMLNMVQHRPHCSH